MKTKDIETERLILRSMTLDDAVDWDAIDGLLTFSAASNSFCSKCWIKKFCGGGCFASNFKRYRNLFIPDDRMCDLSRHIVLQSIVLFAHICKKKYIDFLNRLISNRSFL